MGCHEAVVVSAAGRSLESGWSAGTDARITTMCASGAVTDGPDELEAEAALPSPRFDG